ncbi:MAG: hypothetical protein CL557_11735 [Alphaproteobacteria bacterium]|nr:hypothetical protein [Alphaproteobacteria bacterium]|tara:strand:- start:15102 stop:27995 length:12894 start_codon:yes stop_codon:yes gene_type:complete
MITTGIDKRIQVQQIVDNQLPEFVLSESPKTVDFLKQYYISQEYRGGPIDITDNLDQYLKLDNLTPDVIVGVTTLAETNQDPENIKVGIAITAWGKYYTGEKTINVSNTKGFPNEYGLLKIDDEIITYTGKTSTSFTGCVRGFSGITTYHDDNNPRELVFSTSSAEIHNIGSSVSNLSALFLQEFYKKLKYTLTPGLENSDFISDLDVNNFIKEAKSFFQSKGTEQSFKILFKVLYGVDPTIIDLEDYLIKPSAAKYIRRERIVAERISGNPINLQGQTVSRSADLNTTASISEVEPVLGVPGSGILSDSDYFILDAFIGYADEEYVTGTFNIPGKTKVIGNVPKDSTIITVDSTVGFGTTGTIISGINTNIQYTDKTVNQFLNCSGVDNPISSEDDIRFDDNIFGYENGDLTKKVELRITGILSKFIPNENNRLSIEKERVLIKSLGENIKKGSTNKEIFANSWIYNSSPSYDINSESIIDRGSSTLTLKEDISSDNFDTTGLSTGDYVEVIEKTFNPFKNKSVVTPSNPGGVSPAEIFDISTGNIIKLINVEYNLERTKNYAVRKVLDKVSSTGAPVKYGNQLTTNIQNVYNESDTNLYVASNSLPNYTITKDIVKSEIPIADTSTIQNYNPITEKYSVISFDKDVLFVTGDEVYYSVPEGKATLVGLEEGVYYVKEYPGDRQKINLYLSPSFIETDELLSRSGGTPNNFVEFNIPLTNNDKHTFTLLKHYNQEIGNQRLLKKFPVDLSLNDGKNTETIPGPVGMLIDGVEINNYKSSDSIFYGPIDKVSVLSSGSGYDVINLPEISIAAGLGSTALVKPVVTGDIQEILVDPQNFDIESVNSIKISGGNSSETFLRPIVRKRNREIEFDGRLATANGGVDNQAETITFKENHNLKNGQVLVYNKNRNDQLGITTWGGSNADAYDTLIDGETYWPVVVGLSTIKLFGSEDDYISGINTIAFTSIAKSGIHKFRLKNAKNTLKSVEIISSGSSFINRQVYINPTGISTVNSSASFNNHGFSDGELISYTTAAGIGSTIPTSISGLSTSIQYKIIKLDDNSFRICDAGIGGTSNVNYNNKDYVKFGSTGTGYQVFKYPDIEITSKITYSISTSDKVTLTPIIKGKLNDLILYEKGSSYGSQTVINYQNNPDIIVKVGNSRVGTNIQPALQPIISNGKIIKVNIQNGGGEYYSIPDLKVVGDGNTAKIRPIIDTNPNSKTYLSIIDVKIINGGAGFTTSKTSINVIPSGSNAVFGLDIRKLSINNIEKYGSEILEESQNGLRYSVVGYSTDIGRNFYNDPNPNTNHSSIIGWAYDGNPIYGPYGYSDPTKLGPNIKTLQPSYKLDPSKVIDRPGITTFASGFFADDYVYDPTIGDLDEHNGRYCKTPDYPDGVYAYFVGISDIDQSPKFPYFIGNTYRSSADVLDPESNITQSFDFNNSNLVRNTASYKMISEFTNNDFIVDSDKLIPQLTTVESVTRGSVDSLDIVNSGENYKIGDNITFDNTNTSGSGLSVAVNSISGVPITNIETIYEEYANVKLVWKNSNTVSASISTFHDLSTGNSIEISGISSDLKSVTGSHTIGVNSESTLLYQQCIANPSSLGIVTDIVVGRTSDLISVGSSIGIGSERFFVLNKFEDRNILRCVRGITGTAHTISSKVTLIPNSFDIPVKTDYFDSRLNKIVFFNPKQSVGIATVAGFSTSITVTVAGMNKTVSVPAQSIYLPDHGFKTGDKLIFKEPSNVGFTNIGVSTNGVAGGNVTSIGHDDIVYAINKSKDYIGIVTNVAEIGSGIGTIGQSSGLYFIGDADNDFRYSFRTQYNQVTATAEKIIATVSLSTDHQLQEQDRISLEVKPRDSVGIGTSTAIKVKYNSIKNKLLINPIGFNSTGVNTTTNTLTINSHGLKTGDKVLYDNIGVGQTIVGGLSTTGYFVYRIDDNNIKLSNTYIQSTKVPPDVVSLSNKGGISHELSLINPPINIIKDNNLVFDVSDSSLSGYDFNLYYDNNYIDNFVSTGQTNSYIVSKVGTSGTTGSTVTLNYSDSNPLNLFYNIEKGGFISTSDIDVIDKSRISYIDSKYKNNYSILGVTSTSFKIVLEDKPEILGYASTTIGVGTITYSTDSIRARGPINDVKINSGGEGYKQLPTFVSIASTQGKNAIILPRSKNANKINNTNILNVGFEYASDKTLLPLAKVSPVTSLRNFDTIKAVTITDGGSGYQSNPKLVVVDEDTRQVIESGALEAIISSSTQSIENVNVLSEPKGIGNALIYAIDGTNGVSITNVSIGSSQPDSTTTGIVTFVLGTPVLGFSETPFAVGDAVFVENIQNIDNGGSTINSPSNEFRTYPVTKINSTNPFELEINVNGISTNPGFAKSEQIFASLVNYNKYPKFTITKESTGFIEGEDILVDINGLFVNKKLILDKIGNDYIKILGKYDLQIDDKIKGATSGTVATINTLFENKGYFTVDYSSRRDIGWLDNIGKLDQDYQVLPDNDYYQNLSYTIQSPIEYKELIDPVNRLVHTTGLKNFADIGISSSTNSGLTTAVDASTIVRDFLSDNRVDAINGFDMVRDIDILRNPLRSKYIQFKNKELVNYFKCKTNRVLEIDNINTLFTNATNNASQTGDIVLANGYDRFLIQVRNPENNDIQCSELVTSIDYNSNDVYTIERGSISNTGISTLKDDVYRSLTDVIGVYDDGYKLQFLPTNTFDIDLDIKIFQNSFNSISGDITTGIGTTSFGFAELTGIGAEIGSGTTVTLTSGNVANIESYFVSAELRDTTTFENQIVDLYITHDGTNSYIANYDLDINNDSGIGTFSSKIDSNVLSLEYTNDRSNAIEVRSKIVGFGTTASGIGTYRFKSTEQPDGSEDSIRIQSEFTNVALGATTTIAQFSKTKDTTVKSIIRTSIGNTSSVHQLLMIHDGTNTFIEQYPFISIGNDIGIGTFSSSINGSNFNLIFTPNTEFYGGGNIEVQIFSEIFNTNIDTINTPSILTYGKSIDSLSLLQFDGTNSIRGNTNAFKLRYKNTPIFGKYFNPNSSALESSTGRFTMKNHFFNNNEKLVYTPGSSIDSIGISSLIMTGGNPLPKVVYCIKNDTDRFQVSITSGGSPITFSGLGAGNYHRFEMDKKNEKSFIVLDDIIQSPLAYTPIKQSLTGNVSGQVSISTSVLSLSGISTIAINDILKIDDEYVKITNVGIGTTNVGPISPSGSLKLVEVERGFVGTSASTHTDTTDVRLFKGGYNIIGDTIYFSETPRGNNEIAKSESNRNSGRANFSGRVYLRQDYSSNVIFDDISSQFTGIGRTFVITSSGINTIGLTTGSTLMTVNGFFQKPTTENNLGNNYTFDGNEAVGITSIVYTGISSNNGTIIVSDIDVNQNQLPRSGEIISIASTGGLGIAPLVGAAVTAVIGTGKSIVSVGLGSEDFNGSGYSSGLSTTGDGLISIGITDAAYDHKFESAVTNSVTVSGNGIGAASATFTPMDVSYISRTGVLVLTKNAHDLITSDSHQATTGTQYDGTVGIMTVKLASTPSPALADGQLVKIDDLGVKFKCALDSNATDHDYPREGDPISGKFVPISNVSGGDTFEITVLDYVPSSNTSVHTFVSGVAGAIKRSANTLSIANSGLVFRCSKDGYATDHPYPRAGIDPVAGVSTAIVEATSNSITVNVGSGGGVGTGASIRASVGVGGTLTFEVVTGGSGYVNPIIMPPSPSYENLEIIGVSKLSTGSTTQTGSGTLISLDVGSVSTTGIGSTLYEVKSFEITRKGYGFEKGDVFRPIFDGEIPNKVGIVTDKGLPSMLNNFEITVDSIYTDNFSLVNFGEFDYLDSIQTLQNGSRTRFPLKFDGELVTFKTDSRDVDSQLIEIRSLLLIFINGVVQVPGESYLYDGGTSFVFTEPPDEFDNVSLFFYKGTNNVDIEYTDIIETIKTGDELQILKDPNNKILDQEKRTVLGITTSDVVESNLYFDVGINEDFDRPVIWTKQKRDKVINGEMVYKSRRSIEPLIFPQSKIISGLTTTSTELFVDNLNLFNYELDSPLSANALIVDNSQTLAGASLTAVVSATGTVSSISVVDGGSGYVGATIAVSIGIPTTGTPISSVSLNPIALGTANITAGIITSVTVTNPGLGYTRSNPPQVIAPIPTAPKEVISGIANTSGFTGIVTGITTTGGTSGNPLALKFFINRPDGEACTPLSNGYPIHIFDTSVGSGVTSIDSGNDAVVGIGTTYLDNVYYVRSVAITANRAEFVANVDSGSDVIGIGTTGIGCGKFSWGRLSGFTRSSEPISIAVTGKTVNTGFTTYPTIQRRKAGFRGTGAIDTKL